VSTTPAGYEHADGPLSNADLENLRVSAVSRVSSSPVVSRTSLFGDVDLPMEVGRDAMRPIHVATGAPGLIELEGWAKEIFATEEEASRWLHQTHPLLDGETPLERAKSNSGALRVKDILLAIKYGGVA
jgi:uncharacterized protein (DUF2384 family)